MNVMEELAALLSRFDKGISGFRCLIKQFVWIHGLTQDDRIIGRLRELNNATDVALKHVLRRRRKNNRLRE